MILEEVYKPMENQLLLAVGTAAFGHSAVAETLDPFALPFIKKYLIKNT